MATTDDTEEARRKAEEARQEAEKAREAAEKARQEAEAARKKKEDEAKAKADAKKNPVQVGLALVTKGDAYDWTGGAKTSISLSRTFALKLGIDTTVSLNVANSLSLGLSSKIEWAAGFSASYGRKLDYDKVKKLKTLKGESVDAADLYSLRVGSNPDIKANRERIELGMKILIGAQITVLSSMAAVLLGHQIYVTKEGTVEEMALGLPVSTLQSIYTAVTTAVTLGLMAYANQLWNLKINPRVALTMDDVSGAFLGTRLTTCSNGISMSGFGISLESSVGPGFQMQDETIVGLNAPAASKGGSSLNLSKDGKIVAEGADMSIHLYPGSSQKTAGFTARAQQIMMQVAKGDNIKPTRLELQETQALLQHNRGSALSLKEKTARLLVDKSLLAMDKDKASLSAGGTVMTVSQTGLTLKFGTSTTFKMDPTGFTMGDIKVLSPGAPALTSADLVAATATFVQADALNKVTAKQAQVEDKLLQTKNKLELEATQMEIRLRNELRDLQSKLPGVKV